MTDKGELIFLSGSLRSGTSLAVRQLAAATGGRSCPQPMPLIMVRLMAEFLKSQGASEQLCRYPLADEVFNTTVNSDDLARFLRKRHIASGEAQAWLSEADSYSGVCYRPENAIDRLVGWEGAFDGAGAALSERCKRARKTDRLEGNHM